MTVNDDLTAVLASVFSEADSLLATTTVVAAAGTSTPTDANAVWANAFDAATNTLRIVYV